LPPKKLKHGHGPGLFFRKLLYILVFRKIIKGP